MSKTVKMNRGKVMKKTKSIKADRYGCAKIETDREDIIEDFLNANDTPQTFGEINAYLEEIDCAYPNHKKDRTGLAHALLRMIKKNRIEKLEKTSSNKYPRYRSFSKSTFDASFDGFLLRLIYTSVLFDKNHPFFDNQDDINGKKISDNEVLIKKTVMRLGVMILYMILSSKNNPVIGKNNNNLEMWLKNILSLNEGNYLSDRIFAMLNNKNQDELMQIMMKQYPLIIKQLKNAEKRDYNKWNKKIRDSFLNSNDRVGLRN